MIDNNRHDFALAATYRDRRHGLRLEGEAVMRMQDRLTRATYVLGTLAIVASLLGFRAAAQTTTGSIYGTVTDQTGAVIPGAVVTVTDDQTGIAHTAASDASGNYVFPELQPGSYTASTKVAGFISEVQKSIRLGVAQNVHVSFMLKPGGSSITVTVSAATTLVDTRESQIGQTVDRSRIEDMPLVGRDVDDLVVTVPGISNYTANSQIGSNTGTSFVTNGMRPNFNSTYLDGAYDDGSFRNQGNILPNPDALDQFRLLTSNMDAEFGRAPGAVLNVITRSGTNQYHGVAYDYFRNSILNAENYFTHTANQLRQNEFGASIGGPIKRDKVFLFLSYQGLQHRATVNIGPGTITTLTPLELTGNFSASATKPKITPGKICGSATAPVICGTNGTTGPGIDTVAENLLSYVPLEVNGQTPGQSAPGNTTANQGLARVDYNLSANHEISAMFFTQHGTAQDPADPNQILDYSGSLDYANQTNAVLSDRWIISPTKVNSLHFFYTLNHYVITPIFPYNWASLGSKIQEGAPIFDQAEITVTGFWIMGKGATQGSSNVLQQPMGVFDTFNWTHGRHEIKFGGAFTWTQLAFTGVASGSGVLTFNGGTTGNAVADLELGIANSFKQNSGAFFRHHNADPALYLQDDWRVTNRLTLDPGIRWEVYAPFAGQNNTGTFDPYVESTRFPTAPLGLLSSGDPGVPDGVMNTAYTRFAPRFGFAYDVFGNGRTSVNGAYGIFYSSNQEDFTEGLEQVPFTLSESLSKTANLVCPYGNTGISGCPATSTAGTDPFPYTVSATNPSFPAGAQLASMPLHNSATPYVQEYNLTVQQQLGANWAVQLGYVGNITRKAYLSRDENSPNYVFTPGDPTLSTATLNSRRPYQPGGYTFGLIGEYDPANNTSYNSLQAILTKQFSHGFSVKASYVWSKLLDYVSQDPANDNATTLMNQNDISMDYGPSNYDQPQAFVASYLWAAPEIKHFGWIGKQVLSGWQINGITSWDSGSPFTILSNLDSNQDGNAATDRPNQIGDPVLSGRRARGAKIAEEFNTAAFQQVSTTTPVPYGNVARNSLIGPGFFNTDLAGFKSFPIWRENSLLFRAELFNLFNNVNLSNPNGTFTSPLFGKVTASGNARQVQFALRYSF